MRKFDIEINGSVVAAEAEPRTHLADFLRGQHYLTATHIGCEHGVCGACTVLIEGSPVRSCITFAVACEGARVTTLEGLSDDPIIAALREAFSSNHALQCGYCTPGMLISCRDIIMRIPDANEARIRLELSGNLCRCTGYVGIVESVWQVLAKRVTLKEKPVVPERTLGPVGSRTPSAAQGSQRISRVREGAPVSLHQSAGNWQEVEDRGTELTDSFEVPYSQRTVWDFFGNLDRVARCMPGARLSTPLTDGHAEGELIVRLGPIVSMFHGALEIERNDKEFKGRVRGVGRDSKSGSGARAIVSYAVKALSEDSSRVDVSVKFLLTGMLAQFGRSGLIKDVADHITSVFANNLKESLSGRAIAGGTSGSALNAFQLAWIAVRSQLRRLISKGMGKRN